MDELFLNRVRARKIDQGANSLKINELFVPPNPKELDNTVLTLALLALFGT